MSTDPGEPRGRLAGVFIHLILSPVSDYYIYLVLLVIPVESSCHNYLIIYYHFIIESVLGEVFNTLKLKEQIIFFLQYPMEVRLVLF